MSITNAQLLEAIRNLADKDPPPQHSPDHNRIVRLERDTATLGANMETIADSVGKLASKVDQLIEKRETKWSPIIAAVAVVIAIFTALVGLGAAGPLRVQAEHTSAIKEIAHLMRDHELKDGHSGVISRITSAEEGITNLDTILQREMRLLDDKQDAKIEGLDKRLQQEMRLLLEPIYERLRALERMVFKDYPVPR